MSKKKDAWEAITSTLRSGIPSSEYQMWFSRVTPVELEPPLAVLQVPNKFVATWLQDRYLSNLQKAFQKNLNILPEIRFTYPSPLSQHPAPRRKISRCTAATQPNGLSNQFTFDRFVTAKSNRFALSCAQAVASGRGDGYNPLYFYGSSSSGKTHLLHAIGNQMLGTDPSARVRYVSHRDLFTEFSRAARTQKLEEFRSQFHQLDCLLLDDIHMLDGQEKLQAQLIGLLEPVGGSRRQTVVAAKKPPSQIKKMLSPLTSRLEGGLLVELRPPDQNTKIKIIVTSAKEHSLTVPDDVAFFLASATNDLKTLQHYLSALKTYASLNKGQVELSTAKWIVRNKNAEKVSISDIQRLTSEYFNITLQRLLSNKKDRVYSYPRQLAMYLSRNLTNASYKEIGKAFGNKDHSTVIYAVKRIKAERNKKTGVQEDITRIQKLLV